MENKENLPVEVTFAGVPTIESYAANLQQKLDMCKLLRESGFAPIHFKTDAAVLTAILYGQELGFSPIQSLQCINVIQGKPSIDAFGIKAKILAEGGIIRELEWTDKICRIEGNRAGNVVVTEYSMQEAITAGLSTKDNWKRMPKDMLYARCLSRYGRNHWADKIKGLYGKEEMEDAIIIGEQPLPIGAADSQESTQVDTDIIPGGKYAGKSWQEVPLQYLESLWAKNIPSSKRALEEITRRQDVRDADFAAKKAEQGDVA